MTAELLKRLIEVLGDRAVIVQPDAQAPYLVDQRGYYQGAAAAVVRPASTRQVADVVGIARELGVGIVPQGGNTGLCGGATPDDGGAQIVLSLEKLNAIREVSTVDYSMTVEAGVILQSIHDAASAHDLFFPLDLAAKGSCQIGGNLSTNAGGINVLRYGNARDLVLGVEVVLADGSIWNGLSSLRKDNTGYDLKHLFLGSEGTLGIITAAVLKLFPNPLHRRTAMLAVANPEAACRLLGVARNLSGDAVESYEYISREALECVLEGMGKTDPFSEVHGHYVLMELASGADGAVLDRMLERIVERGMEDEEILDGVLAQNERQREELWQLRELISEAQKHSVKNDVSVPIASLPRFLAEAGQKVTASAPGARPCPFGHIGDGNIHYNILAPDSGDPAEFRGRHGAGLIDAVSDLAMSLDGSFSAEHGVGQLRRDMMKRYKSPEALTLMRNLKSMMDPDGILNPGKVV
ncbi:MAG: FAD-binding oxidoreductase [Gammaproteobacteria bacterium]|nr:FAD-binding oxidoreductase [Gammaproteobacteria bacterium]